jgi:hypothetical protein
MVKSLALVPSPTLINCSDVGITPRKMTLSIVMKKLFSQALTQILMKILYCILHYHNVYEFHNKEKNYTIPPPPLKKNKYTVFSY